MIHVESCTFQKGKVIAGFAKRVVHLVHTADAEVHFTIEIDADGSGKWAPGSFN